MNTPPRSRRRFLGNMALGSAAVALPWVARAQAYPNKPIRIIVGFAAGGTTDALPRLLAGPMGDKLGQPVIIENRTGAAGNIATAFVAKAAPDGYTLMASSGGQLVVSPLTSKMPVDPIKDLIHISVMGEGDQILITNPEVPAKNIAEFIALAKKNPKLLFYGDSGAGGNMNLYLEYFRHLAGVEIEPVHFKGGSLILPDLVANRVQLSLLTFPVAEGYIAQGKLRPLAIYGKKRNPRLPDVPTVAEAGLKPLEAASNWFGLHAPLGTPTPIVQQIRDAMTYALQTDVVKKGLVTLALDPVGNSSEAFGARINAEYETFRQVIKDTNFKVE